MLRIGQEINWFCWWVFGRDSYYKRRVEAIWFDWVILRNNYWNIEVYEWRPENLLEIYLNSQDDEEPPF